jgi:OOP family OmpA-OmpF porin
MEFSSKQGLAAAVAAALALWTAQASADAGFYIGGSVGDATIEASDDVDFDGEDFSLDFDESDTAYKLFAGYMFNDYFGAELSYVDLGEPEDDFTLDGGEIGEIDVDLSAEFTGFTADLVGQLPLGPVDIFAKVGLVSYDAELEVTATDGIDTLSESLEDDGEELHYGIGARFNIGNFGIRGEYEVFDIGDIDDVYMLSLGAELAF